MRKIIFITLLFIFSFSLLGLFFKVEADASCSACYPETQSCSGYSNCYALNGQCVKEASCTCSDDVDGSRYHCTDTTSCSLGACGTCDKAGQTYTSGCGGGGNCSSTEVLECTYYTKPDGSCGGHCNNCIDSANCASPTNTPAPNNPTRTPTPKPPTATPVPARPALCKSATISKTSLGPGESLTITSTANTNQIKTFSYAFYNLDNLFGPNNPKPIYFVANTHYIVANPPPPIDPPSNTITVNYDDLNKPDLNWNSKKPTKIHVLAYFTNTAGGFSLPEAPCVVDFQIQAESGGSCAWSAPIPISTLPGSGSIQTQAEVIYPNNTQLLQSFYRGDQGYWRIVPVVNGNPVWASAGAWSAPISVSTLPGSGTIQTRSDFIIGNGANLIQALWRGDKGFWRIVPVVNGNPVWARAGAWSAPIPISTLPGSGSIQTQAEVIYPNNTQLLQSFYRGDQGYWRIVPVVNGNPVWASAGAWSAPISVSTLPGSGTIQTRSDFIIGNGANLIQALWRGDKGFWRIVPVVNGKPQWSCEAAPTKTPTPLSCQKILGDADCKDGINLVDFEIWRKEFTGELTTKTADFNKDTKISLADFEIWRSSYYK